MKTVILSIPKNIGTRSLQGSSMIQTAEMTADQIDEIESEDGVFTAPDFNLNSFKKIESRSNVIKISKEENINSRTEIFKQENSWAIERIVADDTNLSGNGVSIAILDTGVDTSHPAFVGTNIIASKNFTSETDDDIDGHGTFSAGIAVGKDVRAGNTIHRIGVAREADLIVGKVLSSTGTSVERLLKSIEWASSEGANVISMSLGIDYIGQFRDYIDNQGWDEQTAIAKIVEDVTRVHDLVSMFASLVWRGAYGTRSILVAASGNSCDRAANPPRILSTEPTASGELIVAVGAIDQANDLANFSNRTDGLAKQKIGVVAPGVDVLSAGLNSSLRFDTGTSVACPYAAGVCALIFQQKASQLGGIRNVRPNTVVSTLNSNALVLTNVPIGERGSSGLVQAIV